MIKNFITYVTNTSCRHKLYNYKINKISGYNDNKYNKN